jgi:hypothetical protein
MTTIDATKIGKQLKSRLSGIHALLMAAHQGSADLSAASKGFEREAFVSLFLSQVLPQIYRFGSGEVVDRRGNKSGQIDIIVENPFFPSLRPFDDGPRLYLAEGVAVAIEVKSNIQKQKDELKATSRQLSEVFAEPGGVECASPLAMSDWRIPLFAVGYTGWKTVIAPKRLVDERIVNGILIIDRGIFCARAEYKVPDVVENPEAALWMFICCIHDQMTSVRSISTTPLIYFGDKDESDSS